MGYVGEIRGNFRRPRGGLLHLGDTSSRWPSLTTSRDELGVLAFSTLTLRRVIPAHKRSLFSIPSSGPLIMGKVTTLERTATHLSMAFVRSALGGAFHRLGVPFLCAHFRYRLIVVDTHPSWPRLQQPGRKSPVAAHGEQWASGISDRHVQMHCRE